MPSCRHRFFLFFTLLLLFISVCRLKNINLYQMKSNRCLPAWSWDAMQSPFRLSCVGCLDWQIPLRHPCKANKSRCPNWRCWCLKWRPQTAARSPWARGGGTALNTEPRPPSCNLAVWRYAGTNGSLPCAASPSQRCWRWSRA
ncbi:hypothetical protein V8C44DRAFT_315245 [Trichoderma aethiopicum]